MDDDRPSATALVIAKSQIILVDDPALSWAVNVESRNVYRACLDGVMGRSWTPGRFERLRSRWMEKVTVPGIYLHYALRKLRIAEIVAAILAEAPIMRIIVIAAGFDPLLSALHRRHPHIRFFELDHPATQKFKKPALPDAGANLIFLPVDLMRQTLAEIFQRRAPAFDIPTLVIAEGITMYLDEAQIRAFFQEIHSLAEGPASYFLFTYMERDRSGSIQFRRSTPLVKWWLSFKNEKFRWGIEAERLAPFLSELGYVQLVHCNSEELRRSYLVSRNLGHYPLASGENICLAKIGPKIDSGQIRGTV
jgi:methyltransferase (TIGR00027 family)